MPPPHLCQPGASQPLRLLQAVPRYLQPPPALAGVPSATPWVFILPVPSPAAPEKSVPELADSMQADGPRACRFGRRWYLNNESWHPSVPPFGEMKCILCWCVVSVPARGQHRGRRGCPRASLSASGMGGRGAWGWHRGPPVAQPHSPPRSQGRRTASARSARRPPAPAPPGGTTPAAPSAAVSPRSVRPPWGPSPSQDPSVHPPCPSFSPVFPPQLRTPPRRRCTMPRPRRGAAKQ